MKKVERIIPSNIFVFSYFVDLLDYIYNPDYFSNSFNDAFSQFKKAVEDEYGNLECDNIDGDYVVEFGTVK